jgi:hypothetical protein
VSHNGSEPREARLGVAADVAEISRRGPAAGALDGDDARQSITFRLQELAPWRVKVDFLVYVDPDAAGGREYVPVGYELAAPISIAAANSGPDSAGREFPRISAIFARRRDLYQRHAELLLRHQRGDLADIRRAMLAGRAHKHHALLVADYRARRGSSTRIYDMAATFNVDRTTIYRELRLAMGKGLISADELERRRRPASS